MRFLTGLIVAIGCATIPWLAGRAGRRALGTISGLGLAAMSEYFRRRDQRFVIGLLPGLIGVALAEIVASRVGNSPNSIVSAFGQALIPFLTVGWLVAGFMEDRRL